MAAAALCRSDAAHGRKRPWETALTTAEPAPSVRKTRLTRRLFRAAGPRGGPEDQTLGEVIAGLGDRSFGWLILMFALVNLMPWPPGSTMVLALPLLIVTGQMALGLSQVRLPRFVTERRVGRKTFQRVVLRLRPLIRPIERIVRPRHLFVFGAATERLLGVALFLVAIALFMPIPLSAYLPAFALFVAGFGLVERDGLVTLIGVALGLIAIGVTVAVGGMIVLGAETIID